MLDFTWARFVAEVRKEDGQEYPGKTVYEILSSIQMYLRVQCKRNITLIDKKGCTFRNLNSALNFVMKERARQGIGVDVNQENLITQEQENYLWEHGFLGSENAELLCDTLVWVLGVKFCSEGWARTQKLETKKFTVVFTVWTNWGMNFCSIPRISVRQIMGD